MRRAVVSAIFTGPYELKSVEQNRQAAGVECASAAMAACKKTALFFECFSYVCPEPVLVK
jgi:hypothetical protein